ncbi:hypothetical protein KRR38_30455 [Novosphingobium sp. G106]|uniref:hypothetical protein n=1 Tax=Novosphingobium sp. G106 TaxID=2849500 RepID=UPI001C2CF3B1|nr:hypothetical protein [Novosphingobium sp. G106]MBV1691871.1 hypothetical protein [Novosphingobium sp. G106]
MDEELQDFDLMMMEIGAVGVNTVSRLALDIWVDVLRELDRRGLVELVRGSYDDVRSAQITRLH